jgi:hypothetical protein
VSDSETRATFILRLSREHSAPAGEWHGEVLHVQTGEVRRTAAAPALFNFVCARLEELEREAGAGGLAQPEAAP